jgi:hypothetical protein
MTTKNISYQQYAVLQLLQVLWHNMPQSTIRHLSTEFMKKKWKELYYLISSNHTAKKRQTAKKIN